jgi:hypothetical protein
MKQDERTIDISIAGLTAAWRQTGPGIAIRHGGRWVSRITCAVALAAALAIVLAGCSGGPSGTAQRSPEAGTALDAVRQLEMSRRQAQEAEDEAWSKVLSAYNDATSTHEALGMPVTQAWGEAMRAVDDARAAEREAKHRWLIAAALALGQEPRSTPEADE